MNLSVNIGKNSGGENQIIDLSKDSAHNILITGQTGSGKSFLFHNIFKTLVKNNKVDGVGFVIMDFKHVEFSQYKGSPYLLRPIIYSTKEGLSFLSEIADMAKNRDLGHEDSRKAIIVLIEECDIVYENPELFQKLWIDLHSYKKNSNIYVVFSSSKLSKEVFSDDMVNHSDLRIIFKTKNMSSLYNDIFGDDALKLLSRS